MLSTTPPSKMLDARGRPYFLWDCSLTMEDLQERLAADDPEVRAYWVGKVMRQAKPDDAVVLISPREMRALWPRLERYLGRQHEFWKWLLFERWDAQCRVA